MLAKIIEKSFMSPSRFGLLHPLPPFRTPPLRPRPPDGEFREFPARRFTPQLLSPKASMAASAAARFASR